MQLTIYTPKGNLSLDARFSQNAETDGQHFSLLGPVVPESLDSQGSALGVTRVSFPKTFKNKK